MTPEQREELSRQRREEYLRELDAQNLRFRASLAGARLEAGLVVETIQRRIKAGQPVDMLAVADELRMSRGTLQRRLRSIGRRFGEVREEARLQHAMTALRTSTVSVAYLARHLGITRDGLHKLFRRRLGTTPAKYRKGMS